MGKRLKELLVIFVFFKIIHCLQVIPERVNVTYLNPKYIEYGRAYIKRYGRKSPYYINIVGRNKQTWNNNVSVHLIFHEYLHNEYRRSFVELHYKFCDLINKEPYIGGMLANKGYVCPAPPGQYELLNMTVPVDDFPNVFPFEKGRVTVEGTVTDTGESIGTGYLDAMFKVNKKSKS